MSNTYLVTIIKDIIHRNFKLLLGNSMVIIVNKYRPCKQMYPCFRYAEGFVRSSRTYFIMSW